jgi:hypothetical protein
MRKKIYAHSSEYSDIFTNVIDTAYYTLPNEEKIVVDKLCKTIDTNNHRNSKIFRGMGDKSYRELLVKLYVFLAKKKPKYKKIISDYQVAKLATQRL